MAARVQKNSRSRDSEPAPDTPAGREGSAPHTPPRTPTRTPAGARVPRIFRPIVSRAQRLKPSRVLMHYLAADANLLAAGMSFQALFAVFAAVFVGFSAAGLVVTSDDQLTAALIDVINRVVPGLLGAEGLIDPTQITQATFLGWAGIISLVGLLWTMIAWLYYTRQAVRSIFGLPRDPRGYVVQKVVDLLLAGALGILLVASAVFSIISTAAMNWVLGLLGIGLDSVWASVGTRIGGLALAVVINFITLGAMFRVLSNIRIPWRDLFTGAGLGSLALSLLSVVSSAVIAGASRNPLLATFAVFVGLLLWFNLVSRVILYSASWIAVRLRDRRVDLLPLSLEERMARVDEARLIVARDELRRAEIDYADASFVSKWTAKRRLNRARNALPTDDSSVSAPPSRLDP